jgi:acyl-CoA thioesterase-1
MRPYRSRLLGTFLCLALTACGSSSAPTAPGPPAPRNRIVVLGDSLAVSPSPSQNFVTELQARLTSSHPAWTMTNQGVVGDTTAGGLARLDRVLTGDTAILVLELGANDGLQGIPVTAIEANLGTTIERAQTRGIRVLLCGMETFPFNGVDYALAFHGVFPRVAARYQLTLVPFLLEGVALVPDLNGPDGVHPNAAGARRIAANVWPYLQTLLESLIPHP